MESYSYKVYKLLEFIIVIECISILKHLGGSMKISSENGPILQYTGYCSCLAVDLSAGDPCR